MEFSFVLIVFAILVIIRCFLLVSKVQRTVNVSLTMIGKGMSADCAETISSDNRVVSLQRAAQDYATDHGIKAVDVTLALFLPDGRLFTFLAASNSGDFWSATKGWLVPRGKIKAANDSHATEPLIEFASSPWKVTRRTLIDFAHRTLVR